MFGIIYKAVGPTGKVYIGQTTETLSLRKSKHAYRTKKQDRRGAFQNALLELGGVTAFQWEKIDSAENQEELDGKEIYWIAHYRADDPDYGYNLQGGGIGAKHSETSKQKMSKVQKGKHMLISKETRRKISEAITGEKHPNFGKHLSPETRRKISEAGKGRKNHWYGKHHTEETKRKMSEKLSKITKAIALQIKTDLQAGMRICDIARKHGVSNDTVKNIKSGHCWSWLNVA